MGVDAQTVRGAGPGEAFAEMRAAFERAAARVPVTETMIALAGRTVRLRIAGRHLAARLAAPFVHLRTNASDAPALCADLWDAAEAGGGNPCPIPEVEFDRAWCAGSVAFCWSDDGRIVAYEKDGVATWLDRSERYAVGCVSSAESMTLEDRGRPLRVVLTIWHYDQRAPLVHAGMVATHDRGVLLPGRGGSGKSTTALACAQNGFAYLGDDNVSIERATDGAFVAHSVYASAWLDREHLASFPNLLPRAFTNIPAEDKSLLLLGQAEGVLARQSARVCAVALPKIVDRPDTRVFPVSRGAALLALAPSSVLGMFPRSGSDVFRRLGSLVESVPCLRLEIGSDIDKISRCVGDLLDQVNT